MGRINWARFWGAALMGATLGAGLWLLTSDRFDLGPDQPSVSGVHYTNAAAVNAAIGIGNGSHTSVFIVDTQSIERALLALPSVASADVEVGLPAQLTISIRERAPVMVIDRPDGAYLLDETGVVLQRLVAGQAPPTELPAVDDERQAWAPELTVGQRIDDVDLSAMLQLAALGPAEVGSSAAALTVSADDTDGYVVRPVSGDWRAVFGEYTANLRPPGVIALQVQCLRSLLAADELEVATIYLSPLDDRCGTFVPRATPSPVPSA